MTPEQGIRAAAIQAAASFCAPFSYLQDGRIPNAEDVLFVADVFLGYIESGWESALQVNATDAKKYAASQMAAEAPPTEPASASEAPTVKSVELREERPAEAAQVTFEPDPSIVTQAMQEADTLPAESQAPEPTPEAPPADVIPLSARGVVPQAQNSARRKIEKMRHERATKILNQAATAKALQHKERLVDEAESAGLSNFRMEIGGRVQELGSYLASL